VRRTLTRLLYRLRGEPEPVPTERFVLRGFPVVLQNTRPDIATPAVVERLDDALALIERTQPRRFARLRRDVREMVVVRFPCRGAYLPDRRACLTELTFLARRDIGPATVASSIVHEGMHARIAAMGLHPASRDPAREERICRRAELDFGRALPAAEGAPVIARAEQSLALADEDVAPAIDWELARRQTAEIDRKAGGA
jgi:hypothetical protein